MDDVQRILVVANRTAASEALLEVVRARAAAGPVDVHLVVPAAPTGLSRVLNPDDAPGDAVARMETARAMLAEATGREVTAAVGSADALAAVQDAINAQRFDEIVISTLPRRLSRWLHIDLPHKLTGLGLPVVHVRPDAPPVELRAHELT
jgi:cell pole-organizing protein PopZ